MGNHTTAANYVAVTFILYALKPSRLIESTLMFFLWQHCTLSVSSYTKYLENLLLAPALICNNEFSADFSCFPNIVDELDLFIYYSCIKTHQKACV